MLKQEFESKLGKDISNDEWIIINRVYTFHPSISDKSGKDECVLLYTNFGFRIFEDMLPRADKAQEIESRIFAARHALDQANKEMSEL